MITTASNRQYDEQVVPLSDTLAVYFTNKFSSPIACIESLSIDDLSVQSWKTYDTTNGFDLLTACYPQLCFPIEEGINKTQIYIDAVLKGKGQGLTGSNQLGLAKPEWIKVALHTSIAGSVPVIYVSDSGDFEKIVQSLSHKNNPVAIPQSMGALLANGVVNWNRLNSLKKAWLQTNSGETWSYEFSKNILPVPGLYKDKIIILSAKPYSNVSADTLNLAENEWLAYSLAIRLEHECTHLYTLKRYGCASNNLHDELIADYIGISKALGKYSKEWMLAFMGLEAYPTYRIGARLENYAGNVRPGSEDFKHLTAVIKSAIETIACFDIELGVIDSAVDQLCRMDALCGTDLIEIASVDGLNLLMQKYSELSTRVFK